MRIASDRVKRFLTGIAAGALALAFSYFLRTFLGGVFLPELASQTLFSLVPGEIESRSVESLGSYAKYSGFAGAVIINVLLYGVIGTFTYHLYERLLGGGYLTSAAQSSLLAYSILLALAVSLFTRTEVLTQPTSIPLLSLYLLPPQIAFGFALSSFRNWTLPSMQHLCEKPPSSEGKVDHRRRLIIRAGLTGAVASTIILFYGIDLLFKSPKSSTEPTPESPRSLIAPPQSPIRPRSPFDNPTVAALLASEVTPNDKFYKIDINIITPTVDAKAWNFAVMGLVNNLLTLTYEEFKSLPAVEQYNTLECVSNKTGGDLISTALWKGVQLKYILEKAHVKPEAKYMILRCRDGYDVGIPLERGLLEGSILAYETNRTPLPAEHGYPLRAIIPGHYGMMNAKWITEMELVDKVHLGFWQRRGWSNTAEYQTHSTIITPGESQLRERFENLRPSRVGLGGKVPVAGIAFAGDRGISKVEVSVDGGDTWEEVSIKDPLSGYTWVLWAAEWNPPDKGEYKLTVRATENSGKIQIAEFRDPFPNGASGYHVIDIKVEAPT